MLFVSHLIENLGQVIQVLFSLFRKIYTPYVSGDTYELVNRIGYICDLSMKTVGEMIGREALKSQEVMDLIGKYSKQR